MTTGIESAKQQAALRWGVQAADVLTDDFSTEYFWASEHTIIGAAYSDAQQRRRALVFAVTKAGEALPFGGPEDLGPINRFFAAERIAVPDGLPLDYFADALGSFLGTTRGFVGSGTFLEETARPRIQRWLRSPHDLELFSQHCRDPILEIEPKQWRLQFFYFTPRGAVESWSVTGRPSTIDEVAVSDALPAEAFKFPYVD